jgi:hypothetical protein
VQSPPPEGLALLRAVGDLIVRVEEVAPDHLPPTPAGPVRFVRRNHLAAEVSDLDLVEFIVEIPPLVEVMREALLLAIKLHQGQEGRCPECRKPAPCTTYTHLLRALRAGS